MAYQVSHQSKFICTYILFGLIYIMKLVKYPVRLYWSRSW